eukprot:958584-Rhodomonas_salina.1
MKMREPFSHGPEQPCAHTLRPHAENDSPSRSNDLWRLQGIVTHNILLTKEVFLLRASSRPLCTM